MPSRFAFHVARFWSRLSIVNSCFRALSFPSDILGSIGRFYKLSHKLKLTRPNSRCYAIAFCIACDKFSITFVHSKFVFSCTLLLIRHLGSIGRSYKLIHKLKWTRPNSRCYAIAFCIAGDQDFVAFIQSKFLFSFTLLLTTHLGSIGRFYELSHKLKLTRPNLRCYGIAFCIACDQVFILLSRVNSCSRVLCFSPHIWAYSFTYLN